MTIALLMKLARDSGYFAMTDRLVESSLYVIDPITGKPIARPHDDDRPQWHGLVEPNTRRGE